MDNEPRTINERFQIDALINDLAGDLRELRAGRISIREAKARAELAKQILRGVHYVVTAQKYLGDRAREIAPPPAKSGKSRIHSGGENG